MIILQDIITYKNISCPNELLKQIKIIAEHTKNTWQSNRSLDEIIKDTTIGKIAEYTLKEHISKHSGYAILDYDDFRVDNYEKHAPLDCIIFEKQNSDLQLAINAMNVDFLAYPKFYRKVPSEIEINSWHKYLDYCMNNNKIQPNTDLATLQEIELKNMYDFYARVYVEQISSNLFDIYIIGYITKQNLIKDSVIKRMPQYGKSEQALYIATQIKNGIKFKK